MVEGEVSKFGGGSLQGIPLEERLGRKARCLMSEDVAFYGTLHDEQSPKCGVLFKKKYPVYIG